MEKLLDLKKETVRTDPMVPVLMKIKRIFWETEDIFTVLLEHEDEEDGKFSFLPGQFNMLYAFSKGEAAISISSDPAKENSIMHTIHKVGYVTSALSRLNKGDVIGVRGPFGSSWPVEEAKGKDVIFVAGGIGIAPLRPALYHIFKYRKNYGKITLLYGARTPVDIMFSVEMEEWSKKNKIEILKIVDRSNSFWKGNVGVVTGLFPFVTVDPVSTIAMVCGPETMMKYSIDELKSLGIPSHNIYLSMERNMKCATGFCGHCQFGPNFVCKDGPVFNYSKVKKIFNIREV
jgi:NAD(P)H-flavin reductase